MNIPSKKIAFTCDTMTIQGILHLPLNVNPPLVVGSHGLEGTKNSAKQILLANLLPTLGIAFLRFDHRGCGESDGKFQYDTSLDKRSKDMVAAVHHAVKLGFDGTRIALFGSSLGGAVCIETWNELEKQGLKPLGAVLCATPIKSRTIINIPLEGNLNRPSLPMDFFEKNLLFDLTEKAAKVNNLLIFHGSGDEIVPVKNGQMLFDLAKEPKELVIHAEGDHRMSDKNHQNDFLSRTALWFKNSFFLK